jgi:uncharacterized protein YbcI
VATVTLSGEQLSEAANAVGKIKADFFGRGPEQAKAFLNDDLLVVVFRGGFLDVEETLIAKGRGDKVRDLRTTWQGELDEEMTSAIERVTGFVVNDYFSQVLVNGRLVIELFQLEAK